MSDIEIDEIELKMATWRNSLTRRSDPEGGTFEAKATRVLSFLFELIFTGVLCLSR